jgi:peptidoglycan hydrolase-like protein with peptidoglycan-binding domain
MASGKDLLRLAQSRIGEKYLNVLVPKSNAGKADGIYGPLTVTAVAAFQQMNRLVPDGTVGPRTARKLGVKWPT